MVLDIYKVQKDMEEDVLNSALVGKEVVICRGAALTEKGSF